MYSFIALVFFPTVVTYLYGHYEIERNKVKYHRLSRWLD